MWEVLSRFAQIGSFHAGRPGKSPSIHTVAPTGSSEPDNAENCDRQSALLDPKAFFQCSSSPQIVTNQNQLVSPDHRSVNALDLACRMGFSR